MLFIEILIIKSFSLKIFLDNFYIEFMEIRYISQFVLFVDFYDRGDADF